MQSYSSKIAAPAPASNAFPQADSLPRLLDVLSAACHSPKLDEESLAAAFSITPRQGLYYYSAAAYVGLAYKRGGYIKPTAAGEAINRRDDESHRRAVVFEMILQLPVFREVAIHIADNGFAPPSDEVSAWVFAEEPKLNNTTAARRAKTVLLWVNMIQKEAPQAIRALSSVDEDSLATTSPVDQPEAEPSRLYS